MTPLRRDARRAFTLVELLVVLAIIGTLAVLVMPAMSRVIDAADDTRCASNLRQITTMVLNVAQDNDQRFPEIDNDSANPIHTDTGGAKVWTLPELVKSQGASEDILKCPADARLAGSATGRATSYYQSKHSSYEWLPFFEDEKTTSPTIRAPFGQFVVPLSRVRLLMDYAESGEGPHDRGHDSSAMNVAYADGSVRKVRLDKDEN
jgi:prepilin-type N-terminal cleavage/methylation domain-containing protein/prepilin-type processing-associated H-X9-DG protein